MSHLPNDIRADFILPDLEVSNGKQVLRIFAEEIAVHTHLNADYLYEHLLEQETKSASGIGGGVALAHLQDASLREPVLALARLKHSLDFQSVDQQQVDLVCVLMSPAKDGPLHLQRLSRLSRMLKSEQLCVQLRTARDAHIMRALMNGPEELLIAA